MKQVDEAVAHGARVECGGRVIDGVGCYQPTILTGLTPDNPAYYQEFFGPVAQVYVVADDRAAVALANDSHYGLGGSVWTRDIARGATWLRRLRPAWCLSIRRVIPRLSCRSAA